MGGGARVPAPAHPAAAAAGHLCGAAVRRFVLVALIRGGRRERAVTRAAGRADDHDPPGGTNLLATGGRGVP